MRKATETMLRSLAMLQAIPQYPRSKSTRQIQEELCDLDPDFNVTARSIQRSLEKLSSTFPIAADAHGRANHWYWVDRSALMQIPAMSPPTALVLRMVADYLKSVFPPAVLRQLDAYFRHAEKVLGDSALGRWRGMATIIQRGPVLKPPTIGNDVQEAVCEALLDRRRLHIAYRNRTQRRLVRLVLNPLGLVVREGAVYLVATTSDYDDVRHYVLHRMGEARVLDEPAKAPKGFRLAEHIRQDNQFSYPVGEEKLELKALFDAGVALHLEESRLADDHRTTRRDDGRLLVEATVSDTADLRWWLLGFGAAVEVVGPAWLRCAARCRGGRTRRCS